MLGSIADSIAAISTIFNICSVVECIVSAISYFENHV